jgi:hypothetical protein
VRGEAVHTGFWWGNERGTDHLDNLAVNGKIWIFNKYGRAMD